MSRQHHRAQQSGNSARAADRPRWERVAGPSKVIDFSCHPVEDGQLRINTYTDPDRPTWLKIVGELWERREGTFVLYSTVASVQIDLTEQLDSGKGNHAEVKGVA